MCAISKKIEAELLIRLFIDKFVFDSSNANCQLEDYYNLYDHSHHAIAGSNLPAKQTIKNHSNHINNYLRYFYQKNAVNPVLSIGTYPFKSFQQEILYNRMRALFRFNKYTTMELYTATPYLFPLFIGLIAALQESSDDWTVIKKRSLSYAESIESKICENYSTSQLFQDIPIHQIYIYLLEYYFPDSFIAYINKISNLKMPSDIRRSIEPTLSALINYPLPFGIYTIYGEDSFYSEAMRKIEECFSSITFNDLQSAGTDITDLYHTLSDVCFDIHTQEATIYHDEIEKYSNDITPSSLAFKIRKRISLFNRPI